MTEDNVVTIGADPEAFVTKSGPTEKDCIIPCVGILPGTKDKPAPLKVGEPALLNKNDRRFRCKGYSQNTQINEILNSYGPTGYPRARRKKPKVMRSTEGYFVQEDNVMAEFNIPPCTSLSDFVASINMAIQGVNATLPSGHNLSRASSHKFTSADLDSPQAQQIGCDPDYSAYNMGTVRVNPPSLGNYRYCGGHIHLGGKFNCPDFVVALFMDLKMLRNVELWPEDTKAWYRQPGVYRPKPYGIEYRTLDNGWLWDESKMWLVADASLTLGNWLASTPAADIQKWFRMVEWEKVQRAITSGDMKEIYRITRNLAQQGFPI